MATQIIFNPRLVIERLEKALNDHDIEAFTECFSPFYLSEQPVHPDRSFRGRERMVKEWTEAFQRVPNLKAELLRCAVHEDTVWTEWHMHGTRADNKKLDLWGVTIFGVKDTRITWSHVYLEPIQEPGAGIVSLTG